MSSGGDGILTVTGFGRFEKLHAEYNKLLMANQKLAEQLRRVAQESKKTDDSQGEMLDGLTGKITKMASAYLTVQTAIGMATAALQRHMEIADRAASASTRLADAQANLIYNLGANATNTQRAEMLESAKRIGVDSGMGAPGATNMVATITNAIKSPDPVIRRQVADRIGRKVARYFPNPEDAGLAGQLGASVLNLQAAAPEISEDQAMLMAQTLLSTSQLKGPGEVKNLAAGIFTASNNRFEVKDRFRNLMQTTAIASAFTQLLADDTGEMTGTTTANFVSVFDEVTKGKYKNVPIGDAYRLAAKEMPGFQKSMSDKLMGYAVSKGPQKELLRLAFGDTLTRSIEGEFSVSPQQMDQMFEFAARGTPDLRNAQALRKSAAASESTIADQNAKEGAVYRSLFGGGDSPGYYEKDGWLWNLNRKAYFRSQMFRGRDPAEIGMEMVREDFDYNIQNARGQRNAWSPSWGLAKQRMYGKDQAIYRDTIAKGYEAQAEIAARQYQILSDLNQSIQDNTTMTSNGQNAQAAAAQRNAQVE